MKDEDKYTVPLDDTAGALGSPEVDALLETLDINTEVLNIPDSVGYEMNAMDHSIDGTVDDSVTDIALDSDEGETEVAGSVLPVTEKKRSDRGYVLSMEKRKLNALGYTGMLNKNVTGHFQQLASTRRTDDHGNAEQHEPASFHADTSYHKQFFIQDGGTSGLEEGLLHHAYNTVEKDYKSLECIVSNIDSQEPEKPSDVNALDFVDQFLSINNQYFCEKFENGKADRTKSPPSFTAKGAQTLAIRTNLATQARESGIFDWDEKRASESNSDKVPDAEFDVGSPGKPSDKDRSETNAQDVFEFGFDTQMAAEVMEALIYAPLPNYREKCTHQAPKNIHNSSEAALKNKESKNCSNTKMAGSVSQIKRKRTGKIRSSASRLNGNVPCPFQKHTENLTGYNSPSSIDKSVICRDPLAEKSLNCRNPLTMKKNLRGRSFTVISQQKNDGTSERDNLTGAGNNLSSSKFIGLSQHGEEMLAKKFRKSSRITERTQCQPTETSSERSKVPVNSFKRRMSTNLEFDVPKKRRKKRLGIEVCKTTESKFLKSGSNGSAEVTNSKTIQQPRSTSDLFGTIGLLKLDPWCYPKQKRTHKVVGHQSIGCSNSSSLLTLSDDENKNKYTIEIRKSYRSIGGPLLHSRTELESFPEKNLRGVYVSESAIRSEQMVPTELNRAKSSEPSGKSDIMGPISSADCSENINLGAVPAALRASRTSKSADKIPGKKMISRPSLMRELTRLGYNKSLPNFMPRDLRRRRSNISVLFSQHLKSNILNQQKKIIARLGFSVASCLSDATHFVTDRFVRTRNMLEAIAFGKPVVTHLWLESCGQANCFIDEKGYILRDTKKEKEIGFSMPASLACARQNPLLKGRRVFITPNIKPGIDLVQSLVKAVHGKVVKRIGRAEQKGKIISKDLLVLSSEEEYVICMPLLEKGAAVYDSELLLNGIVIQKLEFERHQLFTNYVENNCSRKCPGKN